MKNTLKANRSILIAAAAVVLSATPVLAQKFNIDYGTAFGSPGPAYVDAATTTGAFGMMGYWNMLPAPGGAFPALFDTAGFPIAATIAGTSAGGSACNDPGTGIGHTRLYDDGLLIGSPGVVRNFVIGPLVPGVYEIFTYSWAPCVPAGAVATQIGVPGSIDPPQLLVTGPFPGHALGLTYARHGGLVVPAGGPFFITIQVTAVAGNGRLNGIQVNQLP